MTRFLALTVLAFLLFLMVRASIRSFLIGLRGARGPAGGRRELRDELVKDPVCETYIPRRKAIARQAGSATHYFCSAACADRFVSHSAGRQG